MAAESECSVMEEIVFNGWSMFVPSSVANDAIEREKVIELLMKISEVSLAND